MNSFFTCIRNNLKTITFKHVKVYFVNNQLKSTLSKSKFSDKSKTRLRYSVC